MSYKIVLNSKLSGARLGRLKTAHGVLGTPFFMTIATRGVVKGITVEELKEAQTEIVLGNTYHLMIRPGRKFLKEKGGLHQFMNWDGPILTDSGGYQVFSLKDHRKITEEGVEFKDPRDGKKYFLSPKESILVQKAIGSDIILALDECTPYSPQKEKVAEAVRRTIKWAHESYKEHAKNPNGQLIFAVGQGDRFLDLREECLARLKEIPFDGFCYGGMAPLKTVYKMLEKTTPFYSVDKPRYLMGVGYPEDIVEAVRRGIDMFDCVIPTREGRHGRVFVRDKKVKLGDPGFYKRLNFYNAEWQKETASIANDCACPACRMYGKDYINYLFKMEDYLGPRLASLHNIYFYQSLMREIRREIQQGNF
jgi:queuine tRNA-ribosyltransferase